MDYEFFERLAPAEAQTYLDRFLEVESSEIRATLEAARAAGVSADFSVDSLPDFLVWLAPRITLVQKEPPADAEWWVKDAMEQHGGFREFDDDSRQLALRAAYYLGQSFVETYPKLRWALGRPDRIEFQQPVITGFRRHADLAALVVAENILRDAQDPQFETIARTAVDTWHSAV
jgi:hypothetical protein